MSQSLELIRIIHCACLFDYTEESGRKLRIFNDKEAHHFEKSGGQLRQLMVNEITLNEKIYHRRLTAVGWDTIRPVNPFRFPNLVRFPKWGVVRFFCVVNETSFTVTRSDCRGWPIYQHNKTFLSLHISTYRQHSSPSGTQNACHINLSSLWHEVAEWLRRWTANQCALHAWVRIPSSSLGMAGTRQGSSGARFLSTILEWEWPECKMCAFFYSAFLYVHGERSAVIHSQ